MTKPVKTVALFGGSFNPPHVGHFDTGAWLHKALKTDEIWVLFSINPEKDPTRYAPLHHRMNMGALLAAHHPDTPFVMSDEEEKLGFHQSFRVLNALREKYPDHRFVWVMGADSLLHFDGWANAKSFIENYPIAVLARPPYTEAALSSKAAFNFAALRHHTPEALLESGKGWLMLNNPPISMSSGRLIDDIKDGRRSFDDPRTDAVAEYIVRHGLYKGGTGARHAAPNP